MPFDGTTYKHDEVLELLRRARERVARPGGWCQGDYNGVYIDDYLRPAQQPADWLP